ncbi:MAG: hypothetical protein AAF928_15585 [Myxococcota bacterium]
MSDGGIAALGTATLCLLIAGVGYVATGVAVGWVGVVGLGGMGTLVLGLVLRRASRTQLTIRRRDGQPWLWVGSHHAKGPFRLEAGRRRGRNDEEAGPHALFLVVSRAGRTICQFAELRRGPAPSGYAPRPMPARVPAFYVAPPLGLAELQAALASPPPSPPDGTLDLNR